MAKVIEWHNSHSNLENSSKRATENIYLFIAVEFVHDVELSNMTDRIISKLN